MTILAAPLQANGMTARQLRQMVELAGGVGVANPGDLQCSAGTGIQTNVTAGRARLRPYDGSVYRGIYDVWNDATFAITHNAADGTNPRIDQIVATVKDNTELASGANLGTLEVVTGTATGGASLDNRTGAAALGINQLLLYDVLVPAGAGSAASYTYRDRRPYANSGAIPRAMSAGLTAPYDAVAMQALGPSVTAAQIAVAAVNYQGAVRMFLPSAITATRIRFSYTQGPTAATGNFIIAIYDASGRLIVSSSSTAFSGAANTLQQQSLTIASTRFEPGVYYVLMGTTIATASSTVIFNGCYAGMASSAMPPIGQAKYATSGGVTAPTTLLSMTDAAVTLAAQFIAVPIITLSSG